MKKFVAADTEDAEVNMTPMLDIVFIMLIFFIVASTFVRESGLDVTREQENNEPKSQSKSRAIYVQICTDNDVFIDRRAVDVRSVRANIEAKLASEPGSVVVIETQGQASTGSLVAVMDQAIAALAPLSISEQSAPCDALSA